MYKRKVILLSILLLFSIIICMPLNVNGIGEGWLTGWNYRKSHLILNSTGASTNYQIMIIVINGSGVDSGDTVYIDNKTKSDFTDVRFTSSDGSTLLDCWDETFFISENISIWVEVSEDLSLTDRTIYIYYDNSEAISIWDGDTTFIFFDDFSGISVNRTKWENLYGSPTVANGFLNITSISSNEGLMSNWTTYGNFTYKAFRMRQNVITWNTLIDCGFSDQLQGTVGSSIRWVGYTSNISRVLTSNITSYSLGFVKIETGGWHLYDILWNSTDIKFLNDNNLTEYSYPTGYICNIPLPVMIYWYYSVNTVSFLTDWCFVRNYVSPEPYQYEWGIEETVSYPQYDDNYGTNSTLSVSTWNFYSFWYIRIGSLSGYIFSYNQSSIFENDTWVSFSDTNNSWANITKIISIDVGNYISWIVYANSSWGYWKTLEQQNVTITAIIIFYFNNGGIIEKNGTELSNETTIIYDSLSPVLHLSGIVSVNHTFINFTISNTLILSNSYNFTVQNSTAVWCYFDVLPEVVIDYSFYLIIGFILLAIGFLIGLLLGKG